jgi:hypothetical protein
VEEHHDRVLFWFVFCGLAVAEDGVAVDMRSGLHHSAHDGVPRSLAAVASSSGKKLAHQR